MDERIDFGMSDPDLVPLIIQVWNIIVLICFLLSVQVILLLSIMMSFLVPWVYFLHTECGDTECGAVNNNSVSWLSA